MKNKVTAFVLISIFIGIGQPLLCQNAYYDVLKLESNLISDKFSPHGGAQILFKYFPIDPKIDNANDSIKALNARLLLNPFLKIYSVSTGDVDGSLGIDVTKLGAAIGGLDVTNFADGLAKFLVGRFKDELNTAFFQKFQDDISNVKYKDIQLLFPETYKVLAKLGTDVYQFNAYLNTLRESFIKDLTNLYKNINSVLAQPKYQAYFAKNPDLGTIIKSSLYFINAYAKSVHPGDVIENYNVNSINLNPKDSDIQKNLRSSINVFKVISASFKAASGSDYWVSADSVRWFFQDAIRQNLYLGLLYQLTDTIHITIDPGTGVNEPKSFANILGDMKQGLNHLTDSINVYINFVQTIATHTDEVNEYLSEIQTKKKSEIDYNDYYKIFSASLDLVQDGLSILELPYLHTLAGVDVGTNIQVYGNKFLFVARDAGELYIDVRTKNYSSAIINLVGIFDTLLAKYSEDPNSKVVWQKIYKYGTFIATVAQAQNSDDVKAAIESIAVPAGSYSVKQKSSWSISLNGYMGYAFDFNGGLYAKSIYAPVGFSISKGLGRKHQWALSFFTSIIDVGAIASYRLTSGPTDTLKQEVRLESIISPSAQLIIGIPKTPITFCAGWRMTPKLFYSGENTFVENAAKSVFNLSVLVDIPIFTIFNRGY